LTSQYIAQVNIDIGLCLMLLLRHYTVYSICLYLLACRGYWFTVRDFFCIKCVLWRCRIITEICRICQNMQDYVL